MHLFRKAIQNESRFRKSLLTRINGDFLLGIVRCLCSDWTFWHNFAHASGNADRFHRFAFRRMGK